MPGALCLVLWSKHWGKQTKMSTQGREGAMCMEDVISYILEQGWGCDFIQDGPGGKLLMFYLGAY